MLQSMFFNEILRIENGNGIDRWNKVKYTFSYHEMKHLTIILARAPNELDTRYVDPRL